MDFAHWSWSSEWSTRRRRADRINAANSAYSQVGPASDNEAADEWACAAFENHQNGSDGATTSAPNVRCCAAPGYRSCHTIIFEPASKEYAFGASGPEAQHSHRMSSVPSWVFRGELDTARTAESRNVSGQGARPRSNTETARSTCTRLRDDLYT